MRSKNRVSRSASTSTSVSSHPLAHAHLIAAKHCPVTPRMLASACVVGLGFGAMNAGAATFTVKSDQDGPAQTTCAAACTLRDAINVAENTPGTDTIKFDTTEFPLTASTPIILTENDDISITQSLIITGPGPGVVTIDGNDAGARIFDIQNATPSVTVLAVTISGVTLTNGSVASSGGAIRTGNAKLTLSNCILSGNDATAGEGGAIHSFGFYSTLTIKDSVFTGNTASDEGGAINVGDTSRLAARGVHISNSRFSGNSAGSSGGGIMFYDTDAPVLVENSVIDGNNIITAGTARGGGIYLYDTDNRGTVTIRNTTISNNSATGSGDGNARGGGIYLYGPDNLVFIDNCTISNNDASGVGTGAGRGGGIYLNNPRSYVELRNTTVADNGAYNDSAGGGIYLFSDDLRMRNVVVADNIADSGRNIVSGGTFLIEFSMIERTDGGSITNLPGQGGGGDNINNIEIDIDNLANNGSGRKTHAMEFGSIPIDRGSNSICTAAAGATTAAKVFDSRGVFRPVDGDFDLVKTCDSGAVEFNGRAFGNCPGAPELTSCQFDTGDANGFTTGTLVIKDNLTNNASDSMALTLSRNSAIIHPDFFGAPVGMDGTASAVCVYIDGALVAQYNAMAGEPDKTGKSQWKQMTSTGSVTNTFSSSTGNADGLTKLTQKSGVINAASISAAAKGVNAPDVTLPAPAAPTVVAEVYTSDDTRCVSTTFPTVLINNNTTLSVKTP